MSMIAAGCLLLLAASTRVDLVDEVYRIPRGEWKYVELDLHQQPATVSATYELQSGSGPVRLALMTREDLQHFRNDADHGVLVVTPPGKSGAFNYRVRRPGEYVIVVDNRAGTQPAAVHLKINLDFARRGPDVTQLPPQRQLTVVVISFAVFLGIVTYSARRLLKVFGPGREPGALKRDLGRNL
jgi:hypothetical protein